MFCDNLVLNAGAGKDLQKNAAQLFLNALGMPPAFLPPNVCKTFSIRIQLADNPFEIIESSVLAE